MTDNTRYFFPVCIYKDVSVNLRYKRTVDRTNHYRSVTLMYTVINHTVDKSNKNYIQVFKSVEVYLSCILFNINHAKKFS